MRKNSVRHFIHAVIDVLPLLVIPIFALNILHKETEPISIEVQENRSIEYNQQIKNGNFEDESSWGYGSATAHTISNNTNSITLKPNTTSTYITALQDLTIAYNNAHKYLIKFDYEFNNLIQMVNVTYTDGNRYLNTPNQTATSGTYQTILYTDMVVRRLQFSFSGGSLTTSAEAKMRNVQMFDLSEMYGIDNEPTIQEFNLNFRNEYYEYTNGTSILINDYTTTFNSTDIGSQFIYALYKPVHDYFNFNNLFNMGAIYDWIQLNLFSGTAPLPIFIIWNVIVYEFFVDLIFLLYGVFMFIIDFAEKCLERPFRRM